MATARLESTKIEKDSKMLTELFHALNVPEEMLEVSQNGEIFSLRHLEKKSSEFKSVRSMFIAHLKNDQKIYFSVESVNKVLNPFLFAQYSLKLRKKKEQFSKCTQSTVFHGTNSSAVIPICQYNFDWRKVRSQHFGKGVYFAKHVTYASHYGIDEDSDVRIMIVTNIIITGKSIGERGITLPSDEESDTSVNEKQVVLVKYEDADVYPAYVVYYKKTDEPLNDDQEPGPSRGPVPLYPFEPIPLVEDDDPNIVVINP
ncbi:protein mono-ADP-ribosyltransferase PARP12-like [Cylas formicarius]|uniref:protein mono-ADP-ribosyltransferase PARP12-like n=1 Tax=Cylas formicarius TaxID=197179 RepID=UPI0029588F4E|nr:protein mono-ADP-ribosyltransferase PARP12-like [Cylas formicarius]